MVQRLFVFILTFCITSTFAQDRKAASDSIDINALRQYPSRDSLKVNKPVMAILPVLIPVSDLNLKVNYWKTWITFGLNLNQASFSNNWSAGAVNSIALGSQFNFKTDYTKGDKNYVSELILQYGKLKNKGQFERKTNDRIFWDNKVGLKLSKNWYFFGSLNFESQFDDGFTYGKDAQGNETRTIISRFMAPGYLTESIGFEYKPVKYFWVRIGTGTARQTFVSDTALYKTNPKNFGVVHGKSFRNELAFQFVTNFDKDIAKNLNLKSHYTMFANYEKFNNVDHRFDMTLAARVNRLVNVSVSGIVLYDDDASTDVQASQTIGFGLMYKIP